MNITIILGLAALSNPAEAARNADLVTTITAPSSLDVYEEGTFNVTVANVGNGNANNTEVVVILPETNTSPTVHIMGILGASSSSCSQVGNTLECNLGRVRKGKSKSVWFDIALPENLDPLTLHADATTTSNVINPGDDSDSVTPALDNFAVSFTAPQALTNIHCTGMGLTSFYECTLYPSSQMTHDIVLESNGDVTIVGQPDYSGSWSASASGDFLQFEYVLGGDVVAEFEGYGTSMNCWEGQTTFPGSSYAAMYEVCK